MAPQTPQHSAPHPEQVQQQQELSLYEIDNQPLQNVPITRRTFANGPPPPSVPGFKIMFHATHVVQETHGIFTYVREQDANLLAQGPGPGFDVISSLQAQLSQVLDRLPQQ